MKAVRIHRFGGLDTLVYEETPCPTPSRGELLVRVKAAGVGNWDALIRSGQSKLGQTLPITLGSDFAGTVEAVGPGGSLFQPGDSVFGVTNPLFTGAYAEFAAVKDGMIALKPSRLGAVEAASVPVVAMTAWQMLFDYGMADATKRVLVQGAAGSVGAYAIQFAKRIGADVTAAVFTKDVEYVRSLGADHVIDVSTQHFETAVKDMDIVLDLVGGETQERSFGVVRPGGVLVSVVAEPSPEKAARHRIRAVFFYVDVNTPGLTMIGDLLQLGQIKPTIGAVLPLAEARRAHEMLAGKPHKRGKIVLTVNEEFAE